MNESLKKEAVLELIAITTNGNFEDLGKKLISVVENYIDRAYKKGWEDSMDRMLKESIKFAKQNGEVGL